nr:type II toxin-antitoxin system VapC family toxin [Candidatus Sigynarchaeum springense]MDO8117140.1 type II toxin-antitoxin system VapC family toxin [Candidatus Sigynarchaeota archaeon]
MTVFIDTDLIINSMKELNSKNPKTNTIRKQARRVLKFLQSTARPVKITSYSLIELYKGAYSSKQVARNIQAVESVVHEAEVVHPGLEDAKECARILSELEPRGIKVPLLDLLISSIVIVSGDVLYTRNVQHFENVPHLHYRNWELEDVPDLPTA